MLQPRSSSVLDEPGAESYIEKHHQLAVENTNNLKLIQNLEELVGFKVKTMADDLSSNQNIGPIKNVQVIRQLCDPLLANRA